MVIFERIHVAAVCSEAQSHLHWQQANRRVVFPVLSLKQCMLSAIPLMAPEDFLGVFLLHQ